MPKNFFDPNETFLDASNLPEFNMSQFEGRLESSISKIWTFFIAGAFVLILFLYAWKIFSLQIVQGEELRKRAENNRLEHSIIFATRGTIFDRFGLPLAWSVPPESVLDPDTHYDWREEGNVANGQALNEYFLRRYSGLDGVSHIAGYLSYPLKDTAGIYYESEFQGIGGTEKMFNKILNGQNGLKIQEVNAVQEVWSESVVEPPHGGEDVVLSIDASLTEVMHDAIRNLAEEVNFQGGSGVMIDVTTGEIIALTNYPEFSSQIMVSRNDTDAIQSYIENVNTPFLNRAVSGLYAPGSIVKPFLALGALEEKIISPEKKILSTGALTIPNPYNPDKPTIFRDWKAHGWVNMRDALAMSSDEYFYQIGGGYESQKGLGIRKIDHYMHLFGFGESTGSMFTNEAIGVIPNPEWKKEVFDGEAWFLGNTYHTAIGQYGVQITPLQAARAVSALANGGYLVRPRIEKDPYIVKKKLDVSPQNIQIVQEGMREAVKRGTAVALNISGLTVAGKTGTAELGYAKKLVNSWVIGFFPYDKPRYAFAVVMEKGPGTNLRGSPLVMRKVLEWIVENRKNEYLTLPPRQM